VTDAQIRHLRSLDAALALTIVVLVMGTILVVFEPSLRVVAVAPRIDLVINTIAALAAVGVAALAWTRYAEQGGVALVFQSAAFAVLALAGTLFVVAAVTGLDDGLGLTVAHPTQAPVYVWTLARLLASGLLVTGAVADLRGRSMTRPIARRTPLLAMIAFGGLLLVVLFADESLPVLISPITPAILETANVDPTRGVTPFGMTLQLAGAALFAAAVLAYRQLRIARGTWPRPYLIGGLVLATFSQIHFALHPGAYTTLVTTGDVLRLSFYVVLLLGIGRDTAEDLRALRLANRELERMHDSDLARATLEERGRLAREIHDGLAQDLWTAKLKQGRVLHRELEDETRTIAREVLSSIDSALADARQAVMALRAEPATGARLDAMLREYFEDFIDRFGLRGSVEIDPDLPVISIRGQAEVLRIVQEALNNVRKHADATVVRLTIEGDDDGLRVSVTDNGRGFDPAAVPDDRYGLKGMRERAELIGARLDLRSAVSGGTTVTLLVPEGGAT
jgi:signal transduction histidine kinase